MIRRKHGLPGTKISMKRTILITTAICITLIAFASSNAFTQACGGVFGKFIVTNPAGKTVPNVTVELLTVPSPEKYGELWKKYGHKEPGAWSNPFTIPGNDAKEIIKHMAALQITRDPCGNPLKQTSGKTRVKTWADYFIDNNGEGKKENFGFCTHETGKEQFLLKISAPGYAPGYYIGHYLGGCDKAWYFTLIKK